MKLRGLIPLLFATCHSFSLTPALYSHRRARCSQIQMASSLPRNLKEMIAQLRDGLQTTLSSRQSRILVEMPIGFEFGVESEKAARKGGKKLVSSADISKSDRELARLFVDMFEGTGLKTLVLFASASEAREARKKWDVGLEARVQALVSKADNIAHTDGSSTSKPPSGGSKSSSGGGGFGGSAAAPNKRGAKRQGKLKKADMNTPSLVSAVRTSAEVVVAVAPNEFQLRALRDFSEFAGQDQLLIILNARLEDERSITPKSRDYFMEGGEGGFTTAYAFLTQPLGIDTAEQDEDPLVLWRSYPENWMLMRKPKIGAPKKVFEDVNSEGRPSIQMMKDALASRDESGNLFEKFFK